MKSIKVKIIASVILCALLSAMVCGGLSILTSKTVSDETSREYMLLCTQNASAVLDRMMGNVELSVENLYSVVLERLDDECVARNLSPGGSADLLAMALLIERCPL